MHGLLALASPLLLAAADPSGDVGPCPRLGGGSSIRDAAAPDLVSAAGDIVELGTSVRFTLRFSGPLDVPDADGRPFRVDIVLLDPDVPSLDAGLYRGVNRLLRYDATADPVTTILLLPEAGQSRFLAPTIDGDTFVMQVPGRTLTEDEDETGTSPGLGQLRWGVVVRDEGSCDLLRDGRPTERLRPADEPGPSNPAGTVSDDPRGSRPLLGLGAAGALGLVAVAAYVLLRRRSAR